MLGDWKRENKSRSRILVKKASEEEGRRKGGMEGRSDGRTEGEARRIKRPGGARAIVPPRKAATWMLPHGGLPGLSASASPSLASPFRLPSSDIFTGTKMAGTTPGCESCCSVYILGRRRLSSEVPSGLRRDTQRAT